MLKLFFLLVIGFAVVDSRITFAKSEVLDDVDLRGVNTASFRCSAGCRVYSPTRNDKIVIVDSAGKEYKNLLNLSDLKVGGHYELPGGKYQLKNKGAANPAFVFYAVEKGASNYGTSVTYVTATTRTTVQTDLLTVMSSSGAIRFSRFAGEYTPDSYPSVYATGFDSVGDASCKPVYQAISGTAILNTAFPIYSPIATINFNKTGENNTVVISGEAYVTTTAGLDSTAVFASPGYVGCKSVEDSLYTSSHMVSFDSEIKASHSSGLFAVIDGEFSIAKREDAGTFDVNDEQQQILYGANKKLARTLDGKSVFIGVQWTRKEGSKDRFAMQIDVMPDDGQPVQTTTRIAPTTSNSGNPFIILSIGTTLFAILRS